LIFILELQLSDCPCFRTFEDALYRKIWKISLGGHSQNAVAGCKMPDTILLEGKLIQRED